MHDLLVQIWVFSVVSSLFSELRISASETMEKIVRFQHFLKLEKKILYLYIYYNESKLYFRSMKLFPFSRERGIFTVF